jgi:predicted TIM-barrel enzyme
MAIEIFPVVHVTNAQEAIGQAEKALDAQADGIYLIDHDPYQDDDAILEALGTLRTERPDAFIGVNLLGTDPIQVFSHLERAYFKHRVDALPDAVWLDDVVEGKKGERTGYAKEYRNTSLRLSPIQILGGVAFKYTRGYTDNPVVAAKRVAALHHTLDVVTTSGSETGVPPSVQKIAAMKRAATQYEKPLAVASGISLENIEKYRGIVDQVLMATSIETHPGSGVFDEARLRDSIQAAHEL